LSSFTDFGLARLTPCSFASLIECWQDVELGAAVDDSFPFSGLSVLPSNAPDGNAGRTLFLL